MAQGSKYKPLRVFVSHAAKDADWEDERVEDVASAIQDAGFEVWLDLWYSRQTQLAQTIHTWRMWINEAILGANYVVCLTSPRYRALWGAGFKRKIPLKKKIQGKIMVSEESMRRLQEKFVGRRRNPSDICTLRLDERGEEVIPEVIYSGFPAYRWTTDREQFIANFRILSDKASDFVSVNDLEDEARPGAVAATEVVKKLEVRNFAMLTPKSGVRREPSTSMVTAKEVGLQNEARAKSGKSKPLPSSSYGMWSHQDSWRAPIGDFPPPWASAWGDDLYGLWADLTVNGTTQRMRWIEPSGPEGAWIGEGDRASQQVIALGFWLADTPCTQAFWQAVTRRSLNQINRVPEIPVVQVSWENVRDEFIDRFAQHLEWGTGQQLCLPSELEWEYAARAGTRTAYWWGENWEFTRGNADEDGRRNYASTAHISPVKRYAPNPWGLFDVHGNVWEWCIDAWRENPNSREQPDPERFVVRGGSWVNSPNTARAASRFRWHRWHANLYQGFRFMLKHPSGPEARPGGAE